MLTPEYKMEKQQSIRTLLQDLKLLVKGFVLVANVLPIFTGFWLAFFITEASFTAIWDKFLFMTLGGTFIIAGALILNNWYEADIDSKMKRTELRPTVTGNFSSKTVLSLGIISSVLGMIFLLLTTLEAFVYGFLGWFTYVVLYTFWSKRKYTLNTVVGSISGAFTPLIGWAVVASSYHIIPIVLFIILFIWQIPHTFAIAMRRYDDYKAANVPMLPVVYGFPMTKRQSAIYIASLFPFPFFFLSVSVGFVILATILNIVWLLIAIHGLFSDKNEVYANRMFYFSLLYLNVVFGSLIVISLPLFSF